MSTLSIVPRGSADTSHVLGAVFAGGRSSRFGSDKAVALFDGRPLVDHAADVLRPWVDAVVVIGGDRPGSIADQPRPDLGPLGGLAGALVHARDSGFDTVLTLACDTPHLPDGLLAELTRRAPSFCIDSPTIGYWPAALADTLIAYLDEAEDRSVRGWARRCGALPVVASGRIANVNTPADLARL